MIEKRIFWVEKGDELNIFFKCSYINRVIDKIIVFEYME